MCRRRAALQAMIEAMATGKVLIVEDDPELRSVLSRSLREEGYDVDTVASGGEVLARTEKALPDIFVIDIGLPDADGRDVCQALRARGIEAPVLFLTARDAVVDRVAGFDAGGDDYVSKPFALVELVARIQALLRRTGGTTAFEAAGLRLDPVSHAVSSAGMEVPLTPTEFRVLALLLGPARRSGPAARARPRRVAARGHRPGEHARRICGAHPEEAQADLRCARDTHRARHRLPHRMIRRRLLVVVLSAVAASIAVLVIGFNVILAHTLDANARSVLRSRAAAQFEVLDISSGRIRLREGSNAAPDSGVWVLEGTRVIERPRARRSVDAQALLAAAAPAGFHKVGGTDVWLYSRPVVTHGARIGSIVVALSVTPYEQTRRTALVSSLIFGVVVLGLVAIAARWLLASALRPVTRMTRQAATWSERDLDRRFGLGDPRDELTELAATLDGLLDRLAASLRHEQRFSAELSHELRTPLSRVLAETELALRRERAPEEYRETLRQVHRNAEQLNRTIDALLAAARYEAGTTHGTADALEVATEAASVCAGIATDRSLALAIAKPDRPIRIGVEADYAERILQPVFENACRYGRSTVNVSIDRAGSTVRYSVVDDGPGVDDADRERIFEPGVRGVTANGSGSGLGLSLARRLAESVAGDIEAIPDASGGRFVVRLPAG